MTVQEYGRFVDPAAGVLRAGLVDREAGRLHIVNGSLLADPPVLSGRSCAFTGLIPLPPVDAPLIVGAALNYLNHAAEAKEVPPSSPLLFRVDASALLGDGGRLVFPQAGDLEFGLQEPYVDPEPELVAVIGLDGRIAGYAAGNDISERLGQTIVGQRGLPWILPASLGARYEYGWFKSLPGFKPLGSLFRGDIDPGDVSIRMIVNGKPVQEGHTRDLIFPAERLVAETARLLGLSRLPAGTCIYTGTPGGIGYQPHNPSQHRPSLRPGDTMTVQLSFGSVTTHIVART